MFYVTCIDDTAIQVCVFKCLHHCLSSKISKRYCLYEEYEVCSK